MEESSRRSPPKRMLPKVNVEIIIVERGKAHDILISEEPKTQEREQDEAKAKEKEIPAPLSDFIKAALLLRRSSHLLPCSSSGRITRLFPHNHLILIGG